MDFMNSTKEFAEEVQRYLDTTGMTPTQFGWQTMGNGSFVFRLRAGISPTLRTVDKVRAWIRKHPAGPRR